MSATDVKHVTPIRTDDRAEYFKGDIYAPGISSGVMIKMIREVGKRDWNELRYRCAYKCDAMFECAAV